MLLHSFRLFIRLCRENIRFTILSVLCLFSGIFSLLFLLERGYCAYLSNASMQDEQRTRTVYFSTQTDGVIEEFYNTIAEDSALPPLEKAAVSGGSYAGIYWDVAGGTEPYATPYGRFFNAEEMDSNARVALLGTGYISSLPHEKLNTLWDDGIQIDSAAFTAIGNFNYVWGDVIQENFYPTLAMPAPVAIPIRTFFEMRLPASRVRCVFSQVLTEEQIAHLSEILSAYEDLQYLVIPQTIKTSNLQLFTSMLSGIAPYALVVLLSVLTTSYLLLYWMKLEIPRLQIYRICGARNGSVIFLAAVQVALLVGIAFLLACGSEAAARAILPEGIITRMPGSLYWMLLALQLLLVVFLVLIRLVRLISVKNLTSLNLEG